MLLHRASVRSLVPCASAWHDPITSFVIALQASVDPATVALSTRPTSISAPAVTRVSESDAAGFRLRSGETRRFSRCDRLFMNRALLSVLRTGASLVLPRANTAEQIPRQVRGSNRVGGHQ